MILPNKFLKEIPDDAIIWRYMNFASFYSMISTETLFFRRLDKYPDQLEATLTEESVKQLHEYSSRFPNANPEVRKEWVASIDEDVKNKRAWVLSNCWTISDHEEYALWRIYLDGSKEGIAIKSTAKRLKESLKRTNYEICFGKVDYDERTLDLTDINMFVMAVSKRKYYAYENEYRALIPHQYQPNINQGSSPVPKFAIGTRVDVNLNLLIDKIYVSPFVEEWFTKIVKSVAHDNLASFDSTNIISSSIKEK
jgi:hypothetical protein